MLYATHISNKLILKKNIIFLTFQPAWKIVFQRRRDNKNNACGSYDNRLVCGCSHAGDIELSPTVQATFMCLN